MGKGRAILIGVVVALLSVCLLAGCGGSNEDKGLTNEQAMKTIASGLEKRWDITDSQAYKDDDSPASLKKAIQAEIDTDASLKDAKFEDSKLQELVLSYANLLNDSMGVVDSYSYSSYEYSVKWTEVYNKRTALIKTFVDEYGLTVSSKYKDTLDDLVKNGGVAQKNAAADEALNALFANATFEKKSQGYGHYTYTAIVENTSDYDFKDVSIILALYDNDGVRANEAYASVNAWESGEKVKFEGYGDVDTSKIKVEISHYEVAD